MDVILADGTGSAKSIGPAYSQLIDRECPCVVMVGNPDVFSMGAATLESLGLALDPVNQRLIPTVVNVRPF